jgi:hypothetical protein
MRVVGQSLRSRRRRHISSGTHSTSCNGQGCRTGRAVPTTDGEDDDVQVPDAQVVRQVQAHLIPLVLPVMDVRVHSRADLYPQDHALLGAHSDLPRGMRARETRSQRGGTPAADWPEMVTNAKYTLRTYAGQRTSKVAGRGSWPSRHRLGWWTGQSVSSVESAEQDK